MPCSQPLHGFMAVKQNASGKRSIVFDPVKGFSDKPVEVSCKSCLGCRLDRSREWAVRCVHEASMYERNCFITLTFNDENQGVLQDLDVRDFQLFMKRLRKRFGAGIRFFACGEYGEKFSRPHHHACLFNFDFPDRVLWQCRNGINLYRSAELEKLWEYGFSTVGDVTFESAAYVARYLLKKVLGTAADAHYAGKRPEFTHMSRRPGIARSWYERYKGDCFPDDFVVYKGRKVGVPKYYGNLYQLEHPEEFEGLKLKRRLSIDPVENTPERRAVKAVCLAQRVKSLFRVV